MPCIQSEMPETLFPRNENVYTLINKEDFKVNFAYTEDYRRSAIPYCQTLLNQRVLS